MAVKSHEAEIRNLIADVVEGRRSRRDFIRNMVAAGISAPFAAQILLASGVARAQERKYVYKPTKRGGGGAVKLLYWQAPTLLNPHFATGTKDQDASRVFYEPLASWDEEGALIPILAAEIPSRDNGGLAADAMSVTWKLKQGVKWHDGQPFTADDCVFNWQYAKDPATAAVSSGVYKDVEVEKVDDHTIKVKFPKPTPFWANAFVGFYGMIIPKHLFADFAGSKSRDAPTNLAPVGTGPFKFAEFKPGDIVKGTIFSDYHVANKPYFDAIEIKGGGDAPSAARAVLQTGEYDIAWNLQVEWEILDKLQQGGKGRLAFEQAGNIEHIALNPTDPNTEVDGERSSMKTKNPALSELAVRQALNLLVDRTSIEKYIYGPTGTATAWFVNNPPKFRSKATWEFNIDKANKILDDAGWAKGPDGIRAKNGHKLHLLFQTSINAPRQKCQQIIKQTCQKAGIELELKAVVAAVFFSSDVANPDTYPHFYADMEMFTTTMGQPDPGIFLQNLTTPEIASKDNKWQGRNYFRYSNPKVDSLVKGAESELDPAKRAAMLIEAHDIAVIQDVCMVPVVARPAVAGVISSLKGEIGGGWDSTTWDTASWFREA